MTLEIVVIFHNQICKRNNHTATVGTGSVTHINLRIFLNNLLLLLSITQMTNLFMLIQEPQHSSNDAGNLSSIRPYNKQDVVYVGNGNNLPISYTGDVNIGKSI